MDIGLKRKLVAGTVVALALAGGGAAIAATQLDSSPSERSAAVVNDAAKTKLDAAVAAGRLTSDQEQSILTDLKQHVTDMVNGVRPSHADADGDGFRPGPGF